MAVEHPRSAWLTIEGVVLIVLGAAALVAPLIAGLATAFFVGWLLIMAGILGFLSAFAGRAHVHLGWSIVSAIVALVVGVLLILFPLVGTLGLALLIAAACVLAGLALAPFLLRTKETAEEEESRIAENMQNPETYEHLVL